MEDFIVWKKGSPAGQNRYSPYRQRIAILVNDRGEVLFPITTFEAIGNPTGILCGTDTQGNIRFVASKMGGDSYKVQGDDSPNCRHISCLNMTKELGLRPLKKKDVFLYKATIKDGKIILVNPRQKPEVI